MTNLWLGNDEDEFERWFDGDRSENFFGWGHQDKDEFANWCNKQECEWGQPELAIHTGFDVTHEWAETDDPLWERFHLHNECPDAREGFAVRPITVLMT